MGETLKIFSYNILETGEVAVSGEPDTGYPVARLYDRSPNLYWKSTGTGQGFGFDAQGFGFDDQQFGPQGGEFYDFLITQPAADIQTVDILYVAGHNFSGRLCEWQYSEDGESWTNAVSAWTQGDNEYIAKALSAAQTKQYWRLRVNGVTDPMAAEIFMSGGYSFGIQTNPPPVHSYRDNVAWSKSIGGQERSVKFGDERKTLSYGLRIDSTALANYQLIRADLDGFSKPMLIKDKDGNYMLARFEPPPAEDYFTKNRTMLDVVLLEML